jgi:lipoate-protein ligase A
VELEQSDHGAVCFDTASAYELTASGRKLVGSAQARRGGALLQHGSILLDIDWEAWASVFAYASEVGRQRALQKLPTRMTSLRGELGREVSALEVCAALRESFERVFDLSLAEARPTDVERAAAGHLASEKYGSHSWTSSK